MASEKAMVLAANSLEEVNQAVFCRLFLVTTIQRENTSSRMKVKKRR
jgi:hypothetical protein